ncbi:MAG: right-handed parallel beta-helix repeat-containing protein [Elusimicrobiota bacterium]
MSQILKGNGLILVFAIMGLAAAPLCAVEYFVDPHNGDDGNTCASWQAACRAYPGAAAKAQMGDTINLNEGVYGEPEMTRLDNDGYIVKGHGRVIVTVNGKLNKRYSVFEGLTFLNTSASAMDWDTTVRNCTFTDERAGPPSGIAVYASFHNMTVEGCLFKNIYLAIRNEGSQELVARNNTFVDVYTGFSIGATKAFAKIHDSIFYNVQKAIASQGPYTFVDYNDFYLTPEKIIGTAHYGLHNLEVDPQFVDPDNGVYLLKPTSPLLTAGSVDADPTESRINRIGAYGAGMYFSLSGDSTGADPYTGWVDQNGTALVSNGQAVSPLIEVNAQGFLVLKEGSEYVRMLSPVLDLGSASNQVRAIRYEALQDLTLPAGERHAADFDAATVVRESRWRSSAAQFGPSDPNPPWNTTTRGGVIDLPDRVRYAQLEITLRSDAR